ncbi:hypothetical protein EV368DRAFT_68636 [Lentinula lateritia]|nr:hypothetical protein EV368DRAFT_68636 [Lentinula lateritia]
MSGTEMGAFLGGGLLFIPRTLLEQIKQIIPPLNGTLHKEQSGHVEVLGSTLDMVKEFIVGSGVQSCAGLELELVRAKKDFRLTPLEPSRPLEPSISPTPFEFEQNFESVTCIAAFFIASTLGLFTFAYAAPLAPTDTINELLLLQA